MDKFLLINSFVSLSLVASIAIAGEAPAASTAYYYGQGRILNLQTAQSSTEETLLVRIGDPANQRLTEIACIRDPGKSASVSPTYMKIDGTTVWLSDQQDLNTSGKLVGTGSVSGTPWAWNYLQFSMKYYLSSQPGAYVRIEDVNYLAQNMLVARKQLYLSDGTPLSLWDAELPLISADDYQKHFSDMGCPPIQAP